jgi:hypothetical protein
LPAPVECNLDDDFSFLPEQSRASSSALLLVQQHTASAMSKEAVAFMEFQGGLMVYYPK